MAQPIKNNMDELLKVLKGPGIPTPEQLKTLIKTLDNHRILAKVFILEGTPYVFKDSPMKYIVFREQVADRFGIGSQDVAIVGSARLGYSPSPSKFGQLFSETSDVDVVIVSEGLFHKGTHELFEELAQLDPPLYVVRSHIERQQERIEIAAKPLRSIKEGIRNFVFGNFNPGLLSPGNRLRHEIFNKISSTSGLFLSLEPQVFVSKIRCRVFRTWKTAEDYYSNTLHEAKNAFAKGRDQIDLIEDEDDDGEVPKAASPDAPATPVSAETSAKKPPEQRKASS